jgi:hypothetical protein
MDTPIAKDTVTPAKRPSTVQEAGRKVGRKVKEKYGQSFYVEISKKGGKNHRGSARPGMVRRDWPQGRRNGAPTPRLRGFREHRQKGSRSAPHRIPCSSPRS